MGKGGFGGLGGNDGRTEIGDRFGRVPLGTITFIKPCGVGILTQTPCAVISHTWKRGGVLG